MRRTRQIRCFFTLMQFYTTIVLLLLLFGFGYRQYTIAIYNTRTLLRSSFYILYQVQTILGRSFALSLYDTARALSLSFSRYLAKKAFAFCCAHTHAPFGILLWLLGCLLLLIYF